MASGLNLSHLADGTFEYAWFLEAFTNSGANGWIIIGRGREPLHVNASMSKFSDW